MDVINDDISKKNKFLHILVLTGFIILSAVTILATTFLLVNKFEKKDSESNISFISKEITKKEFKFKRRWDDSVWYCNDSDNYCFLNYALYLQDESLCNGIDIIDMKETCILEVKEKTIAFPDSKIVIKTDDEYKSVCAGRTELIDKKAQPEFQYRLMDDCYSNYARQQHDSNYCRFIVRDKEYQSMSSKEDCFSRAYHEDVATYKLPYIRGFFANSDLGFTFITPGVSTNVKFSLYLNRIDPIDKIVVEQIDKGGVFVKDIGELDNLKYSNVLPIMSEMEGDPLYFRVKMIVSGLKWPVYSNDIARLRVYDFSKNSVRNPFDSSKIITWDKTRDYSVVANELIILFYEDTSSARIAEIIKELNGVIINEPIMVDYFGVYFKEAGDKKSMEDLIERVRAYAEVYLVAPNGVASID